MSESAPEVTTVVVDAAPDGEPASDDGSDVVVIDTGDNSGTGIEEALVENALDEAEWRGRTEARIAELEAAVFTAQATAEVAETLAETAVEIAETTPVVEIESQPETTDDDVDQRPHFVHRSFRELLGRDR